MSRKRLQILAQRGSFYAVADGIGGAQAGQIASEMMLKNVIAGYYDSPAPDLQTAMHEAIVQTNDRIYHLAQMIPERYGMGTTLVGAIFIEDRVVIAQVGDSRAYLLRDGQILQITHDHSWVEEQVRAGLMRREDAEMSPFRNVITRSIGAAPNVVPDFYEERARSRRRLGALFGWPDGPCAGRGDSADRRSAGAFRSGPPTDRTRQLRGAGATTSPSSSSPCANLLSVDEPNESAQATPSSDSAQTVRQLPHRSRITLRKRHSCRRSYRSRAMRQSAGISAQLAMHPSPPRGGWRKAIRTRMTGKAGCNSRRACRIMKE